MAGLEQASNEKVLLLRVLLVRARSGSSIMRACSVFELFLLSAFGAGAAVDTHEGAAASDTLSR